ncbi:MAG: hypothetical protein ACT6QS_16510 [Flavobacteriales bacterium]
MKKTPCFLFFSVCVFITSCSKVRYNDFSKSDFANDREVYKLYESIKPLGTVSMTDPSARSIIISIKNAADKVVERYGIDNARRFSEELADDRQAIVPETRQVPSCCTLNANGTTNWSCCNFFETLVVTLDVYGMEPPEGASRSQIEQYYKLVQASICANC